jgi:hypothetical protein
VVHPQSDLEKYSLLILPDCINVDAALVKRLRVFIKRGGKLLASGTSGLSADGTQVLLPELGIVTKGVSPYTTTYLRLGPEIGQGVPPTDHVMYERGLRVVAARGARTLARVVEPYFERAWDHFSSHRQTPPAKVTPYAAAVEKGGVAYIPFPIFAAYANHGNYPYRLLVRNLLERLLPDPLLRACAPTSTEATVMRQKGRTIVHVLQYCPERRAPNLDIVEDIVPIANVGLSLRFAKRPKRVYLAPSRAAVPLEYKDGRVEVTLPEVRGHEMVVFE